MKRSNDIEMQKDPSAKGNKLFCDAILEQNLNDVTRLIQQVDVNGLNCNGTTPLIMASGNGHLPVVEALLNHGAVVDKARTDNGATPLFMASGNGHLPVVEALLGKGADPNMAITNGATPLYVASLLGYNLVVKALLGKGADPNKARTTDGLTPLFIATQYGDLEVVEALLKYGADPNKARTDTGETPIQVATTREITDLMREYERRNIIMATSESLQPITRDTDMTLPKDLYDYMGKKDANGNYVAGRRRKTRKSRKSKKSKKSRKSKKSKKSRKSKKRRIL